MRKFLLLFCALFMALTPVPGMALEWVDKELPEDCDDINNNGICDINEDIGCPEDMWTQTDCSRTKSVYLLGCGTIESCVQCNSGYVLVDDYYTFWFGDDVLDVAGCTKTCDASTCKSDIIWTAGNTGYQKRTERRCSGTNCIETIAYQCAPGYYGSSTNGTSGCTKCPTEGGFAGASPAGTTAASGCYIPSGITGSDTSGNFRYSANAYYCN